LAFGWLGERAWAHGLGQRYDLPVPLELYLLGAAAAVVASFAFLILFRKAARAKPSAVLAKGLIPDFCIALLQGLSVTLFLLVVAAGLLGNQHPLKNIAPTFVWVLWWVGFTFVAAFAVNLWPIASPFLVIFQWSDRAYHRWSGRSMVLALPYPRRLGAWPAFLLLLLFAWFELVASDRDSPALIASTSLAYATLTWVGCVLFGPRAWLRGGEAFSLYFDLLGRFAPLRVAPVQGRWTWRLRPFGLGLLARHSLAPSLIAFTLLMLATVSVDGFLETPPWAALMERLTPPPRSPLERGSPPLWPATALLGIAPAAFAAIYLATVRSMVSIVPASPPASILAGRFVLTLVPIAIAYHLAHYLSFLLLAGQLAIPLASDPLGLGWDLFGTTLYRIDIGIIDARTVWLVAVGAIVIGHIAATWLAHETALDVFADARTARLSQVPVLVLMVAYTMLSLWILAQPIIESRR
jgi:hypothetical protein